MMQTKALTVAIGGRQLLEGLDLVVAPGDVVGLVGPNGSGKSTLLRTLAGLHLPDAGIVEFSPPEAVIGHLPQEPDCSPGATVRAYLGERTGVTAAQSALDEATAALAEGRPGADDAYAQALETWLQLGGADLDERAVAVTAGLGLDVSLDVDMSALSGGQAARAGLAALLLSRYDVYLLDEPTNNLDLEGIAQLEKFVGGLRSGVVVVSHDREFLARTVTRIVELDKAQHRIRHYGGGYDSYLEERDRVKRRAVEDYEEYADTKAGLEAQAKAQRARSEKGVRNARKSTDNDKIGRRNRAESAEKQAGKARQTERRIERLSVVEEPRKEWALQMEITVAASAGVSVATLRQAVVRRGDFRLGPVDVQVDRGDRVAITGPNGAGKTTLLGALLGRTPLESGAAALGPGVVVGEVDQARDLFIGDEPLLEVFRSAAGDQPPTEVRTLLAKYGLRGEDTLRPAATLSPGERTRSALALLQARGVNLLVLDEPTNHLDLPAIEQLESALDVYPGTLLLVTHDRRMLDAIGVNRRFKVADGRVTTD
ncbi:ABC-F family ATP-binding cassette domain-containing protein [Streptomyces sp. NPDC007851]|uniref:ABC-F family ATP-binding cassette domain-containing protein n=1 Tax=Streptomyces sp. NPDC007851 TaxID=3155008 RepID=UPI0034111255